jgi:hypothetical protein
VGRGEKVLSKGRDAGGILSDSRASNGDGLYISATRPLHTGDDNVKV